MTQYSRYAKFAGTYTDPAKDEHKFIADLAKLIESTGATVLIPSHDETETIARHRDLLPAGTIIPIAEYEQIRLANNKQRSTNLARELGLRVPLTIDSWDTPEHLEQLLAAERLERCVVKLRKSNGSKGVFYAESPGSAAAIARELISDLKLDRDAYPIAQELVAGDGLGVSALYWHGECVASFSHRRIAERILTGGTSSIRQRVDADIAEADAIRLLDSLCWHGLAMVEFKGSALEQPYFMEINPRLWGSLYLPVLSGVDFPVLLHQLATDMPISYDRESLEDPVAAWVLGTLMRSMSLLGQRRIRSAVEGLVDLLSADGFDDLHRDDPGAFVGQAANYAKRLVADRSLNPPLATAQ